QSMIVAYRSVSRVAVLVVVSVVLLAADSMARARAEARRQPAQQESQQAAAHSSRQQAQQQTQEQAQQHPLFKRSDQLDQLVSAAVSGAVEKFGKGGLSPEKIAITVIDLNDRLNPAWASHRGQQPIYPASVVKLFYLVAAHHQIETFALKETPELDRALH